MEKKLGIVPCYRLFFGKGKRFLFEKSKEFSLVINYRVLFGKSQEFSFLVVAPCSHLVNAHTLTLSIKRDPTGLLFLLAFVLLLLSCLVDLFLRALSAHCCQPSQTTRSGGHHHFSARFWHCTHIHPLSQFSKGGQGAVLPSTFCPRRLYSDSATCLKKTKNKIND